MKASEVFTWGAVIVGLGFGTFAIYKGVMALPWVKKKDDTISPSEAQTYQAYELAAQLKAEYAALPYGGQGFPRMVGTPEVKQARDDYMHERQEYLDLRREMGLETETEPFIARSAEDIARYETLAGEYREHLAAYEKFTLLVGAM